MINDMNALMRVHTELPLGMMRQINVADVYVMTSSWRITLTSWLRQPEFRSCHLATLPARADEQLIMS